MQFFGQFGTVQAAQAGIEILWFVKVLETAPMGSLPQPALFIPVRPLAGWLPELALPVDAPVPLAPETATPLPAAPLPPPLAATPLVAPLAAMPDEPLPVTAPLVEPLFASPLPAPEPELAPLELTLPLMPLIAIPEALKPEPMTVPGVSLHAAAVTSATHGIVRSTTVRFIGRPCRVSKLERFARRGEHHNESPPHGQPFIPSVLSLPQVWPPMAKLINQTLRSWAPASSAASSRRLKLRDPQ
jgi:hypothetical protein